MKKTIATITMMLSLAACGDDNANPGEESISPVPPSKPLPPASFCDSLAENAIEGSYSMNTRLDLGELSQEQSAVYLERAANLNAFLAGDDTGLSIVEEAALAFFINSLGDEKIDELSAFSERLAGLPEILRDVRIDSVLDVEKAALIEDEGAVENEEVLHLASQRIETVNFQLDGEEIAISASSLRENLEDEPLSVARSCDQVRLEAHALPFSMEDMTLALVDRFAMDSFGTNYSEAIENILDCRSVANLVEERLGSDCPAPISDPAGYAGCRAANDVITRRLEQSCDRAAEALSASSLPDAEAPLYLTLEGEGVLNEDLVIEGTLSGQADGNQVEGEFTLTP